MESNKVLTERDLMIKMVVSAWETHHTRVTKLISSLTDEQLMMETAPGRNRGVYLLGHLVAVSDHMQTLLEWGERHYPQLEAIYIKTPDKSVSESPSAKELREYWQAINDTVTAHINKMKPEDWFSRHTAVSPEDFAKEPHRNKLNILINRTNHMGYHLGQLVYLAKK
jgi:hypothetical protein